MTFRRRYLQKRAVFCRWIEERVRQKASDYVRVPAFSSSTGDLMNAVWRRKYPSIEEKSPYNVVVASNRRSSKRSAF